MDRATFESLQERGGFTAFALLPMLVAEGGYEFGQKFLQKTPEILRNIAREKASIASDDEHELTRVANRVRFVLAQIESLKGNLEAHKQIQGLTTIFAERAAEAMGIIEAYIDDFRRFSVGV